MINTAIKAAKAAGKILMENYGKVNNVNTKSDKSLVTEIDAACEKKIKEIIFSKYPKHNIIGEEEGEDDKGSDYKWIVDPLDGTHNYIFNIPIFGTSIGLAYKNELIGGVVYIPPLKELYVAEKGKGCFLNGKRLMIKDTSLKQSLVSFSSGYIRSNAEESQRIANKFLNNCFEIRVSGCAIFNITGILKNTFGVMISRNAKDWDVAAGVLMIRESDGIATDYEGKEWALGSRSILACNKVCHKESLMLLK